MQFDPAASDLLAEILRWRRDVRHFRTDPIPEPLLERLRRSMDFSPSVGNARPWRVIRVESPELRQSVRENFLDASARSAASYDDETRAEYLNLKLAGLDEAPVQLAVFTLGDPGEGRRLGRHTLPEMLAQSTAMAIHAMWLMARSLNLGLGMVSILDPRAVERAFTVPADWHFSAYLCLGWPAFQDDTPLLHRVGWQENTSTEWQIR